MALQPHSHKHLLASYVVGFVLSLALTIMAYTMVVNREFFSSGLVVGAVVALAGLQFVAQLVFFLHVGTEPKTGWKLFTFINMVGVVFILVAGSLWIMYNLNYNMDHHRNSKDTQEYLHSQDSL